MDETSMPWLSAWLADVQGVRAGPDALADPARVAARIGVSARKAAQALPFDTDPTGFVACLESLAAKHGRND